MAKAKHWVADLLVRVLPIWRGQVGYACELMETTIIGLTIKFSEIVKELNKVKVNGDALVSGDVGSANEGEQKSIENEFTGIKGLIASGDSVAATKALAALQARVANRQATYERKITEINQANDVIKTQIEDVLVDLQFQDRVSQILRQVAQAQQKLADVVKDAQKADTLDKGTKSFDVDEWLMQLQDGYAMEEQVSIHAGSSNRQGESKKVDEITFF